MMHRTITYTFILSLVVSSAWMGSSLAMLPDSSPLTSALAKIDYEKKYPLHSAAKTENIVALKKLLDKEHRYINEQDHDGKTPLCVAAENGKFRSVKMLVLQGANVYFRDKNDCNAKDLAIQNKYSVITTYLALWNDLYSLGKQWRSFEDFANIYLELTDQQAACKNWKHVVEMIKRFGGYKEAKHELYTWAIQKYHQIQEKELPQASKENKLKLLSLCDILVKKLPVYESFFLLDALSRLKKILEFKNVADPKKAKLIIEKMVSMYDNLIFAKERGPLLSAYKTLFEKTRGGLTTTLPTDKEFYTMQKLSKVPNERMEEIEEVEENDPVINPIFGTNQCWGSGIVFEPPFDSGTPCN